MNENAKKDELAAVPKRTDKRLTVLGLGNFDSFYVSEMSSSDFTLAKPDL